MKILLVRPGEAPCEEEIGHSLSDMQQTVGGPIQAVYPFEDSVALVCHEEGKLLGLELNRALRTGEGEVYDVIAGPFFVCGLSGGGFASLTQEQTERYLDRFRDPEQFLLCGGQLIVLTIPPGAEAQEAKG